MNRYEDVSRDEIYRGLIAFEGYTRDLKPLPEIILCKNCRFARFCGDSECISCGVTHVSF